MLCSMQGFWSKLFGGGGGSGSGTNIDDTAAVEEEFATELFLELHELHHEKEQAEFSRTWRGRLLHLAGHVLSVYCVYKLFMVCVARAAYTNAQSASR